MGQAPSCCTVCEIDLQPTVERLEIVSTFRALGDPTRYDIYRLIASQPDQICVCNITDQFEVSQPTISHHLRILREAGLITVSRRGTWAWYEIDPRGIERMREALTTFQPLAFSGAA